MKTSRAISLGVNLFFNVLGESDILASGGFVDGALEAAASVPPKRNNRRPPFCPLLIPFACAVLNVDDAGAAIIATRSPARVVGISLIGSDSVGR